MGYCSVGLVESLLAMPERRGDDKPLLPPYSRKTAAFLKGGCKMEEMKVFSRLL